MTLAPSLQRISEEPFRIFFPTGVLLGLAGVSLWLLYYAGVTVSYPNITHARLMIEGFMAAFVFGFLGTAGPRLTSAPHFSLAELLLIFTFQLFAAGAHVSEAHRLGDFCFLIALLIFVFGLVARIFRRKDSPPPNFALVALGLMCGVVGTLLVAVSEPAYYSRAYQFGSALLSECFVLFPVLGVAPFFIRRLLDLPTPDLPESRALPPQWWGRAAFALIIGLTIVASFYIEMVDWSRFGGWLRVAAVLLYGVNTMTFRGRSALAGALRTAIMSILLGFVLIPLLAIYRVGALHVVFITGFSLMALTVATRVVFGHSGNLHLLRKRLWFFITMSALLFLAMGSRLTADLAPRARVIHLLAAAVCWIAAVLVWSVRVIPKVAVIERE